MDVNCFELLSNEIISCIASHLDLASLNCFTSTSQQLNVFKNIRNEQWRQYYAQRWLLDDKELAIYSYDNWRERYENRLKSEKEYIKRIMEKREEPKKEVISDPAEGEEENYYNLWQVPRDGSDQFDNYHPADQDPWAFLLLDCSDEFSVDQIKECFYQIDDFFDDDTPFTKEDARREVLSGRFEILVTALSKYAAKDVSILGETMGLSILSEQFYRKEFKEVRTRPLGLLGLLAKILDVTLPVDTLRYVLLCLWSVMIDAEDDEAQDFLVGLDLIPKLINVVMKTTDIEIRDHALGILTYFRAPEDENEEKFKRVAVNAEFMKRLIELLFDPNMEDIISLSQPVRVFGLANKSVIEEQQFIRRLIEANVNCTDKERLQHLLRILQGYCGRFEDPCCREVVQHETALEFLLDLVNDSKEEVERNSAAYALTAIQFVAMTKFGFKRLVELNIIDKILPFMEDPTNNHLFSCIYWILHEYITYANENDLVDEIYAKILRYKDALLERRSSLEREDIIDSYNRFWLNASEQHLSLDVSIRLSDIALSIFVNDTEDKEMKDDSATLLAQIVEQNVKAVEGKDLTPVFDYMVNRLINASEKFEENADDLGFVDPDEDKEVQWPLHILTHLVRVDYFKKLTIQNERLMAKLWLISGLKSSKNMCRYYVAYYFSLMVGVQGWDSSSALKYIEDFAMSVPCVENSEICFLLGELYLLLQKDSPKQLILFGTWILAQMSMKDCRKRLRSKPLDPERLKWLEDYSHSKVQYHMKNFMRNMNAEL